VTNLLKKHDEFPVALIQQATDFLSDKFSLITIDGQIRVLINRNIHALLHEDIDPTTVKVELVKRADANVIVERALENSDIALPEKYIQLVIKRWLKSPKTTMYQGTAFSPIPQNSEALNLWRGPSLRPQEGDWQVIRDFLFEVLSDSDSDKFDYLVKFLAHAIQRPEEKPEIMPCFIGGQGTGKGTFLRILERIWKHTCLLIQSAEEVVGRFTGAMERTYIVAFDEAWFSGNKATTNALKSKITEPMMRIEEKNQPSRTIRSFHRFVAVTNESHIAHIDRDDRRFYVCQVSEIYKQDKVYFSRLHAGINDDSVIKAFIYHLTMVDLTDFNVRNRPLTRELAEQKHDSLDPLSHFIIEIIENAQVNEQFRLSETNPTFIPTRVIKDAYLQFNPQAQKYSLISDKRLVREFKKVFPKMSDSRPSQTGRARGLWFPALPDLRSQFDIWIGHKNEWNIDYEFEKQRGESGSSGAFEGGNAYSRAKWGREY
jgi:hypothetical protein